MQYRRLGPAGPPVSEICLGSMSWGAASTTEQAHAVIDAAVAAGVNLIDTAELYPVPFGAATFGAAEEVLGRWIATRHPAESLIIATKITSRTSEYPWLRGGSPRLDRHHIEQAIDASLRRLRVEAIGLYQLHWPDRSSNYFGQLGYRHVEDDRAIPIEETLGSLADMVRLGKIRYVGVCNETPWGAMTYLRLAEREGWPRVVSIQNPYNLLNRTFEIGLAEVAMRERCPLLAYSPLAHGTLTGKYLGGALPPDSRLAKFPFFKRYRGARAERAVRAYVELAREFGLSPVQMALAFHATRPFLAGSIVAVSSLAQLEETLGAADLVLPRELEARIEQVHAADANPCP